ncbi:ComEA family DNA-binding protein [Motilimonas pumila]|nr:helix-hairpin-helix domain-containing protein [Motilimonas pumila]
MSFRSLSLAAMIAIASCALNAQAADNAATVTTSEQSSETVNINTASADELSKLNGVGDAKSQAIVAYRQQHGQFETVEQITQVDGIGESILTKNKALLSVK